VNTDEIIRRLEVVEREVTALGERLKALETLDSHQREINTTVLSAVASAHSAIRNAVRLSQGGGGERSAGK
jgi:hypothetical protein